MENKKIKSGVIIILILIIFGLGGYIYYDKFYKKQESNIVEDCKNNNEVLSNALVEGVGKELYNKTIIRNQDDNSLYFYDKNKKDMSEFVDADKLSVAFALVDNYYVKENTSIADYCNRVDAGDGHYGFSGVGSPDKNCALAEISKIGFEKAYHSIFGKDNIKYLMFISFNKFFVDNDNEVLEVYRTQSTGYITQFKYSAISYDKTEMKDDYIYVYTKGVFVDKEKGIYSDPELTNLIADKSQVNEDWFNADNINEIIMNKYQDKAGKFKLTFKQDSDNNWAWISTELVK